jgi:holo-[acyl-carrier protein] synthase
VIVNIGLDLVEIDRIAHAMANPRFVERVLTEAEREVCRSASSVAGRWAAKEAIYKALGKDIGWLDIEILNIEGGKPLVKILKKGVMEPDCFLHVTISHERSVAGAVAIYEKL